MGNKLLRRSEPADEFVEPTGVYETCEWDVKDVRSMVADHIIAPRFAGLEDGTPATSECPICFNVQVPARTNACPYCMSERFKVRFQEPTTDALAAAVALHRAARDGKPLPLSPAPSGGGTRIDRPKTLAVAEDRLAPDKAAAPPAAPAPLKPMYATVQERNELLKQMAAQEMGPTAFEVRTGIREPPPLPLAASVSSESPRHHRRVRSGGSAGGGDGVGGGGGASRHGGRLGGGAAPSPRGAPRAGLSLFDDFMYSATGADAAVAGRGSRDHGRRGGTGYPGAEAGRGGGARMDGTAAAFGDGDDDWAGLLRPSPFGPDAARARNRGERARTRGRGGDVRRGGDGTPRSGRSPHALGRRGETDDAMAVEEVMLLEALRRSLEDSTETSSESVEHDSAAGRGAVMGEGPAPGSQAPRLSAITTPSLLASSAASAAAAAGAPGVSSGAAPLDATSGTGGGARSRGASGVTDEEDEEAMLALALELSMHDDVPVSASGRGSGGGRDGAAAGGAVERAGAGSSSGSRGLPVMKPAASLDAAAAQLMLSPIQRPADSHTRAIPSMTLDASPLTTGASSAPHGGAAPPAVSAAQSGDACADDTGRTSTTGGGASSP